MPDPIIGEPQFDRDKIKSAMQRIVEALKADPTISPHHALAALGNVAGHLLATKFDSTERELLAQQLAWNIPLYMHVYLQGERRLRV